MPFDARHGADVECRAVPDLLRRLRALREHPRAPLVGRVAGHARRIALAAVLLLATYVFASKVAPHYPIGKWLFWVYAKLWGYTLLFTLACVSGGHLALEWLLPRGLSLRARLAMSAPAGVVVFFLGAFVAGLLRLYGPTFAIAWPVLLVAAGARPIHRRLRRARRHVRRARRAGGATPWWTWPIAGFGLLAVGAIYFSILTPRNIAFDSQFYHLGLAQQYVAEGGIVRSAEGWLSAAIPHLASVLYTWGMLLPGMPPVHGVLLAGHLEFAVFLLTLATMPLLVRWLVPRARAGTAWVALFLFPGIFLYDSSLSTAADHITALFAVPIYYAFVKAFRALEPRYCALLAAMASGALLTKYQGVQLALFPALGIVLRALHLGSRALWRRLQAAPGVRPPVDWRFLTGPAMAVGTGLVLTSPHWMKNLVWYGDPLYPYLNGYFRPRPWSSDAAATFRDYFEGVQVGAWRPKGTLGARLKETFEALYSFSFEPHDWPKFHGKVPVFGSLFTLGTLALPFLRRTWRIWGLVAAGHVAVFQWYWSMHQDRYLQTIVPWMACAVAAILVLVWRSGWLARAPAVGLVGLQIVWGGDVYFFGTHAMMQTVPAKAVIDMLGQGYRRKYDGRLDLGTELVKVGDVLPAHARVLNHEDNRRLGLWRAVVSDFVPWQFGIRWGELESPRAMHDKLLELEVTHIIWRTHKSRGLDSLAGDLRFFEYVTNWAEPVTKVGGRTVVAVASEPPEGPFDDTVAYLGCGPVFRRGLHHLTTLNVFDKWQAVRGVEPFDPAPQAAGELATFVARASFVVVGPRCRPALPATALGDFTQVATREGEQLWVRSRAAHEPTPERPPVAPPAPDDDDDLDPP